MTFVQCYYCLLLFLYETEKLSSSTFAVSSKKCTKMFSPYSYSIHYSLFMQKMLPLYCVNSGKISRSKYSRSTSTKTLIPIIMCLSIKSNNGAQWKPRYWNCNAKILCNKGSFFWDPESGHELKLFLAKNQASNW